MKPLKLGLILGMMLVALMPVGLTVQTAVAAGEAYPHHNEPNGKLCDPSGANCKPVPGKAICNGDDVLIGAPADTTGNGTANDCIPADQPGGPIMVYLKIVIRYMSGLVGLAIILAIIIGGYQYMTSSGNPATVEKAKKTIASAIAGLIAFILLFAIMNYLIPGGVFS